MGGTGDRQKLFLKKKFPNLQKDFRIYKIKGFFNENGKLVPGEGGFGI